MKGDYLYKFRRGDPIFEIYSDNGEMRIRHGFAVQRYAYSRVVTTLLTRSGGIKFAGFGQFNQTYHDSDVRGNHQHMYHTYTSAEMLIKDLHIFRMRYRKRTGVLLEYITVPFCSFEEVSQCLNTGS